MKQSKLKSVLDSVYLVPVLIEHLITGGNDTTNKILHDACINNDEVKEFAGIVELLKYHASMPERSFIPDYPQLRKGLTQYFYQYLSTIWKQLGMTDMNVNMLDYCCGSGVYGEQFLRDNIASKVTWVDKSLNMTDDFMLLNKIGSFPGYEDAIAIDFEREPNWFYDMFGMREPFNVILLSEILHCKNDEGRKYLIDSSYRMLKKTGLLVINENVDWCMQFRINKLKRENIERVMTPADVESLMSTEFPFQFQKKKQLSIQNHNIIVYEKI